MRMVKTLMPSSRAIRAACTGEMLPALLSPSVSRMITRLLASLSRRRFTPVARGGTVGDAPGAHLVEQVAEHAVVERQRALRVGVGGEDHQPDAVILPR